LTVEYFRTRISPVWFYDRRNAGRSAYTKEKVPNGFPGQHLDRERSLPVLIVPRSRRKKSVPIRVDWAKAVLEELIRRPILPDRDKDLLLQNLSR
jgi:hypothetical protein